MTKITDAEVRLALTTFYNHETWKPAHDRMRAALEAAEAVREKAEKPDPQDDLPTAEDVRGILAPTIPEGFIPWHGGECPVAGETVVDIVFRGDCRGRGESAATWYWRHDGDDSDIIAYRIHKPADFQLEAGKFYVTASGERVGPMKPYKGFTGFYADNSVGWWDSHGKGRATENGSTPDILALAANQGESNE